MIAFALADFRDWRRRRCSKAILKGCIIAAIAAMVGPLHPSFLALGCAAALVIAGWEEGYRYQSVSSRSRLLLSFPAGPLGMAAGKALSLAAVWGCFILVFSPLFAAALFAWGCPPLFLVSVLTISAIAYLVSASVAFLLCLLFGTFSGPFGLFLFAVWTAPCFFVGWTKALHPFFQIIAASRPGAGAEYLLGLSAEAIAAACFLLLSVPALTRARRRHHG